MRLHFTNEAIMEGPQIMTHAGNREPFVQMSPYGFDALRAFA